jgi:hypothetical protein
VPGDLQFLTLNDFTPGIRHRALGVGESSRTPPGAADPSATFRCRVLPDGALGPMPKMVESHEVNVTVAADDTDLRISGFHITGPMQEATSESDYTGNDNVEAHLAIQTFDGATERWYWFRVQLWNSTEDVDTIHSEPITSAADDIYRPTAFVDARMHATDATALGDIFVVAGWHSDDMSASPNIWLIYPDPDVPNSNGTKVIYNLNEVTLMVQHQGRVVSVDDHVFDHGGSGKWIINDQLIWTQVNLPTYLDEDADTIPESVGVFTQGPVSGYGAVCSASAQELLLVKHRGGATIISGDLDDPTVMSLPGVTSTRGAVTYGVYTPIGFVYGVKNGGVHVWGGGDSSDKISQFLEDDFWMMRPADWVAFDGKFDVFGDWILCPNNWVYDIETQSWWRIEDPATYKIFQWAVSPQNDMFYGAPVTFQDNSTPAFYRFDAGNLVSDYQWRSQFLPMSIDRYMEIRELSLRAISPAGESTVTITLTDEDGNEQQETFDVTNTTLPRIQRKNTAFTGTGVKVTIAASSLDGEPAPLIYELNIGYQPGQNVGME